MVQNKPKKLALNRNTIRALTGPEMDAVAGGAQRMSGPGNGIVIIATGAKTTSVKCVAAAGYLRTSLDLR
jgi:hypothetical protein